MRRRGRKMGGGDRDGEKKERGEERGERRWG